MSYERASRIVIVLLLAATVVPATASANMANPSQGGDVVGEPAGELADMHIEHENLRIDLRPLERAEEALVEATYSIRNDGSERTIDLVFIAAGLEGPEGGVWLDGQPVEYEVGGIAEELPWSAPRTTPGLDGRPLPYEARVEGHLRFSLTIASGRHDVTVRYAARAGAYSGNSPARYWQLGYVLSPARQWPSFGSLDVVVQVAPGWSAASEPHLDRAGDELRGSFQGIPADALAITTQAPLPTSPWLPLVATIAAALTVGWFIAWVGGRFLGARGRRARWLLPVSVVYSIIAAFVVVSVGSESLSGQFLPAAQRAWTYGYGYGLLLFLAYPLIVIVSIVAMQLIAGLVGRRSARQAPPLCSNRRS